MRFIYYYTGAVNGEDSLGHYVRTLLQIGSCSPRSPSPVPGCQATFNALSTSGSSDALPSTSGQSLHATGSRLGCRRRAARRSAPTKRSPRSSPLESYLFGR